MLTVHHLAKSPSDRIVWLCDEIALPCERSRYEAPEFAGETLTAAELRMRLPRFPTERDLSQSPNTAACIARLHERPACRTAMTKAEPA